MILNLNQAKMLLEMFGGEDCEIALQVSAVGHSGPGIYAHYADYPEDGSELLDEHAPDCRHLLAHFTEVVNEHGPDSDEAKAFISRWDHAESFLDLAEMAQWVKKSLCPK